MLMRGVMVGLGEYAFNYATIDLSSGVFRWASFRTTKDGSKLHTLL